MTADGDQPVCLYQLERPLGARPYWYIAGGVLAVLVAVLVFGVRVATPPGKGLPFPVFIGATVIPTMLRMALVWFGREIDLETKTGKIRILKLGEKRDSGAASSSRHEERQS